MKNDVKQHIRNLRINERSFFALSAGLILVGGGIAVSPQLDDIVGIVSLTFGVYSGLVAQEYHNMVYDIVTCDQKVKKLGM